MDIIKTTDKHDNSTFPKPKSNLISKTTNMQDKWTFPKPGFISKTTDMQDKWTFPNLINKINDKQKDVLNKY